jgi:hypothetical protein
MEDNLEKIKYPIGKFNCPAKITSEQINSWINDIEEFTNSLNKTYENLDKNLLNKSYRQGGWTINQIIHHLFDSHVNAYIRTKLILTEDKPTIKPYDENAWSDLQDINSVPAEVSINLIDGLHKRWMALVRTLKPSDFKKEMYHPEHKRNIPLDELLGMYAWHGKHHLAHILSVKK